MGVVGAITVAVIVVTVAFVRVRSSLPDEHRVAPRYASILGRGRPRGWRKPDADAAARRGVRPPRRAPSGYHAPSP
ncbi:hypothetical protein [Streptomyces endophytica]|uniref:Secreted protein n=1 Tax=Streptomyces endophytica TaxID=2991496 RepID=A0ABY6PEG8_9ACTN|nr:hypothetical protein [Streptomyces endophytica]UZJ32161.1 hypothetical protein OJ254_20125 [Streptomyces endophytica]